MNYAPASLKKAETQPATETREKRPAVVSSVSVKKKSELSKIVSNFVAEEAANIKNKTVNDIIIPTIRDTIWSVFTSSLEMLLYGGASRFGRDSGHSGSYASPYFNYSTKKSRDRDRDRDRVAEPRSSNRLDPDEIVFRTYSDAESVLDLLKDDVEEYGLARMLDFYDLANCAGKAPHTAHRYGWTSLERAEIVRLRGGAGYVIKFPKAMAVER